MLGLTLLEGGAVSAAVLAAIVISNVPEGLSSAAGVEAQRPLRVVRLRRLGRDRRGQRPRRRPRLPAARRSAPASLAALITALAAGAILAMVADTMIPEAFDEAHLFTGLICTAGFILAFTISRW